MTKLKTIGVIGALLLGSSPLALAQTNSTTGAGGTNSGTTMMSQPTSPPQGGSHPPMASPQNAPASRAVTGSGAAAPGPHTARMSDQDVKKRLESAGYASVSNIKPMKSGGYTARAMHDGKRVTVGVDGNGEIMAK
ncbi:MAG TPA: hypothetical protein VHT04_19505 [Stellaceae bacterium]|jgi:hypothetical protein|nr:hypothetical protein [Stellaceae bacterium]